MGSAILLIALAAIYFIPTMVASSRGHRQAGAIFALNLLLGWTLVGWVIALVWSVTAKEEPRAVLVSTVDPNGPIDGDFKTCPECAEQVRKEAIICRFCRHEFGEVTASAD